MIEFKNVSKTYLQKQGEYHALHDISFQVVRGRIRGIIGENGAGKTSLLRCANLLERPTSGEVCIQDQALMNLSKTALREARQSIGFISQGCTLLASETVYDNIALPLRLLGYKQERIHALIEPLLEMTQLEGHAYHYPGQLSGGQKQKAVIARELIKHPRVVLCDEITSALDPQTAQTIVKLLQRLQQEFALTILLITHDMNVLKELCDEVTLLSQGHIIEQTDVVSFFSKPQTELAKTFVSKALHHQLPDFLTKNLSTRPARQTILKITFCGRMTHEPIMSDLTGELGLRFNIIQAHIDQVRCKSFGVTFLQTADTMDKIQKSIAYLSTKNISAEILGYVD
jgi:D-methionine transport system ATP-binding protein